MTKRKFSKEKVEEIIKECKTIADFCRKVGWQPRGDNYKVFHRYVRDYGLNTSHFTGCKTNINNILNKHNDKPLSDILVNPSYYRNRELKKRLVKEGIKEYKCEICGISNWNDKELVLQLHHIDGNNVNNELDNLIFICPNCHSQTKTFSGRKNLKKKKDTKKIKQFIEKPLKCMINKSRKSRSPIKEELINNFKELKSYVQVGKIYGVSDNAVRKWCKKYNLPIKSKEMISFINEI